MSGIDPELPIALERFGDVLVHRLHVLRRRSRRRRLIASCAAALALLGGSAIAATRVIEGLSDDHQITPEAYILDPAQVLYGQYQRDLQGDMEASGGLLTLPASAGILAGSTLYREPMSGGGLCLRLLHWRTCGNALDEHMPVLGLAITVPDAPYVYLGIQAASVSRLVVRCKGTTRDVTSHAGDRAFVYIAPRGTDVHLCTLTSMLRRGGTVTDYLP